MNSLKKLLAVSLSACLLVTGFACSSPDNNDDNGGGGDNVTVKTISSSMLDGKVANLMEAQGLGIIEKADNTTKTKASPYGAVAYADSFETTQKKSEFAKSTKDGFSDVCFHKTEGGVNKSYKKLNKKYQKHHHKQMECGVTDCDKISDEILQEENSGAVDTVLSLDARVNKLYTIGNFTFMSVSSAIEGKVQALTEKSLQKHSFSPSGGFPTYVNVEDNFDKGYTFSWISVSVDDKSGMIPIKVKESEENYHMINYWSDDFNQSFIIDNSTGVTYSLSQFKYIYSVKDGIIKVHDDAVVGKFDYYKPVISNGELSFTKIEFPQGVEGRIYTDIYGNIIVSKDVLIAEQGLNQFGEKKVAQNMIFAQKNKEVYDFLINSNNHRQDKAEAYKKSTIYHNGSDGRLYRVNYLGEMTNLSVNVLDENCEWQAVGNDVNVEFTLGYICTRIGYDASARWNALMITCIKNGFAYYSTAAHSDGYTIWERVILGQEDGFSGVVKMPTQGFADDQNNAVKDFIKDFSDKGLPRADKYSVVLIGNTQMLYTAENKVVLRDVSTGEEKFIELSTNTICTPHDSGSLYIEGLGYISVEKQIDLTTFNKESFSIQPLVNKTVFDEYYKVLIGNI